MKFAIHASALVALISSQLVSCWNMTIYDSSNCAGNFYSVYPTEAHTKYFEMKGSWGEGMDCTFHGVDGSTCACKEQFPVGKSVLSAVGNCRDFSGPHASGLHEVVQAEGECKTTIFNVLSVECWDV